MEMQESAQISQRIVTFLNNGNYDGLIDFFKQANGKNKSLILTSIFDISLNKNNQFLLTSNQFSLLNKNLLDLSFDYEAATLIALVNHINLAKEQNHSKAKDFFQNLILEQIKKQPSWLDKKDEDGNTLLHAIVKNKVDELIVPICEQDIAVPNVSGYQLMVNIENHNCETPLLLALKDNNQQIAKKLLAYNASFFFKRNEKGEYLRNSYLYSHYLEFLLGSGQLVSADYLRKILTSLENQKRSKELQDRFKLREFIDSVAITLVGLNGRGADIDLKHWSEMYADGISQKTKMCTLDACFTYGEDFGVSLNYLVIHIRALLEIWMNTKDASYRGKVEEELLTAINTAKIDQETTLLQLTALDDQKLWDSHITGLVQRMQVQKTLCYPSGWPGSIQEGGHAIYIVLTPTNISIYNLGGGVDSKYNKELLVDDSKALPATKRIRLDNGELRDYLKDLVWANLKGVDAKSIKKSISKIYNEDIFERIVETEAPVQQAEILQTIGNCIVKNYLFAMRCRLGNADYKKLYLDELDLTLQQIQSYCGELPSSKSVVDALKTNEVVFSNITTNEINQLTAFRNPASQCLQSSKQVTSRNSLIGGGMNHLRLHPSSQIFFHRGQKTYVANENTSYSTVRPYI